MKNEFDNKLYCAMCGKICYTQRGASEALYSSKRHVYGRHNQTIKKRMSKYTPQRKYYCKVCGYYHLTHRNHNPDSRLYAHEVYHEVSKAI